METMTIKDAEEIAKAAQAFSEACERAGIPWASLFVGRGKPESVSLGCAPAALLALGGTVSDHGGWHRVDLGILHSLDFGAAPSVGDAVLGGGAA